VAKLGFQGIELSARGTYDPMWHRFPRPMGCPVAGDDGSAFRLHFQPLRRRSSPNAQKNATVQTVQLTALNLLLPIHPLPFRR